MLMTGSLGMYMLAESACMRPSSADTCISLSIFPTCGGARADIINVIDCFKRLEHLAERQIIVFKPKVWGAMQKTYLSLRVTQWNMQQWALDNQTRVDAPFLRGSLGMRASEESVRRLLRTFSELRLRL